MIIYGISRQNRDRKDLRAISVSSAALAELRYAQFRDQRFFVRFRAPTHRSRVLQERLQRIEMQRQAPIDLAMKASMHFVEKAVTQ